ncbi:sigma 54-interacting transcriptional regulator [Burkholderiaceae bacterium UC74_6]
MHQASEQLLGASFAMDAVRTQIRRIARLDATVLIEGETGTGKEVAARSVHYLGTRGDRPFVPVNCGALADALVESELFGHERGAFTDAKASSLGLVSEARDGTLFLDEVDALSLKAQAALLRFLQDGSYRRVGGTGLRHSESRVIVASNANLQELAEARLFRKDLLYRINVLSVRMPPLRERGDDVLELANNFLRRLALHHGRPAARFSVAALQFMRSHSWPGNVRELENLVQRAFLLSEQDEIDIGRTGRSARPERAEPTSLKAAKQRAVAELEGDFVRRLLEQTQGNISQAARLAGQDRSAFRRLVKRCALAPVQAGIKPADGC